MTDVYYMNAAQTHITGRSLLQQLWDSADTINKKIDETKNLVLKAQYARALADVYDEIYILQKQGAD